MEICDFDRLFSFGSHLLNLSSNFSKTMIFEKLKPGLSDCERIITPPARRAWWSIKFALFLFYFFPFRKSGYRSRAIPLAFLCCLAHIATHHLSPFHSRICLQYTHFNVYAEISKQKLGSPCKNSQSLLTKSLTCQVIALYFTTHPRTDYLELLRRNHRD